MCLILHKDGPTHPESELKLDFTDLIDNCDYIDWDNLDSLNKTLHGKLMIMQLNIRSIKCKYNDLIELIQKLSYPDILILCETWLKPNDSQPQINGYNYSGHHRLNRKGGGVGFLIKEHLKFRELPNLSLDCESSESIFIELKGNHHNMVLGSIYQPPNTSVPNFINSYTEMCQKLSTFKHVVIGLDHNLDLLKSSTHSQTQQFLETTLEYNLIPTITKPTRVTHNSATLIDNILLKTENHELHQSKVIIDNISDHYPSLIVLEDFNLTKCAPHQIKRRKIGTKEINEIKTRLANINWETELATKSTNEAFGMFHDKLTKIIDMVAPEKTIFKSKKNHQFPGTCLVSNGVMKKKRDCTN